MFDLEQSIAKWRQQILAAGISAPALLDELESHLREEIERLIQSGMNEPEAFASAIQKFGQPQLLNREFVKTGSFDNFLYRDINLTIPASLNRLLGLLWLVWFLHSFCGYNSLYGRSKLAFLTQHASSALPLLALLMFTATLVGGGLLLLDFKRGRKLVRSVAMIWLFWWAMHDCLWAYLAGFSVQSCLAVNIVPLTLMVVSIFILHLPETVNFKATVKL